MAARTRSITEELINLGLEELHKTPNSEVFTEEDFIPRLPVVHRQLDSTRPRSWCFFRTLLTVSSRAFWRRQQG